MSKIAWKTEEFGEALKDFVGQIVATDYAEEPFGIKGAPGIERKGKVLCVQVRTDVYDKDQFEWYPPTNVKKTKLVERGHLHSTDFGGLCWRYTFLKSVLSNTLLLASVRWAYFIEALNAVGAMKDVSISGANDDERMKSLATSLLGMTFRWQEQECESLVKLKGGEQKKFNLLIPVEYLGKKAIEEAAGAKQVSLGEPTSVSEPIGAPSTEV